MARTYTFPMPELVDISASTGYPVDEVAETLDDLEASGWIERDGDTVTVYTEHGLVDVYGEEPEL